MNITSRDRQIFKFIEEYGAITNQQATSIFFAGVQGSSSRRLTALEKSNILVSYQRGYNKVYSFVEGRQLSLHDIGVLDFYAYIYRIGGEIIDFQRTPHYLNNTLIPDALVKFRIPFEDGSLLCKAFIEYDLNHYSSETKFAVSYEKLRREKTLESYCGESKFPLIIVARPTPGIRYNSKNFNIIYTDLKFNNVEKFIYSLFN